MPCSHWLPGAIGLTAPVLVSCKIHRRNVSRQLSLSRESPCKCVKLLRRNKPRRSEAEPRELKRLLFFMAVRGWGRSKPVAPNTMPNGADNPEGRQKNRRVEITFTTTQ
jgi:hypothetical protein